MQTKPIIKRTKGETQSNEQVVLFLSLLILSISSVNPDAKGESWVIINSESIDSKSKKLADEIKNKTEGFEFLANINTSNILRWKANDFKPQNNK
mgnify:CR=1 FL=1